MIRRAALHAQDLAVGYTSRRAACAVLEHVLPSAHGREQAYLLAQLVVCLEHAGRQADALARLGELARVMPLHPVVRARRGRDGSPGR